MATNRNRPPTPNRYPHISARQPQTVAFNPGEIETIQVFDDGPAWSWTPDVRLRVAMRVLPDEARP